MARIQERSDSRSISGIGTNARVTYKYDLRDYASETAARSALASTAPSNVTIDGIPLNTVEPRLSPVGLVGNFLGSVVYKHSSESPEQDQPAVIDEEKLSFQFSGGPTFFTRALSQNHYDRDGAPGSAPDVGNYLNVNKLGEIEGVELPIPDSGFQIQKKLDLGSTDSEINDWIEDRIAQIWTTNDAEFRSLATEDCMFTGFSGDQLSDDTFDIVFDFAVIIGEDYTVDKFDLGGGNTFTIGARIPGFHVIWTMSEPQQSGTVIIPKPIGVYVAKVLETSDFSTIMTGAS